MRIQHIIEQGAPKKRKVNVDEEKDFAEHFWDVVNAVRQGRYKSEPGDINAVSNQIEEERRLRNR